MNNQQISHIVIVVTAIVAVGTIAAIDLLRGGDGAAIAASYTVIGSLVGYEFGSQPLPANTTTNVTSSTSTPTDQGSGN